MTQRSIHIARLVLISSALIGVAGQEARAESACKGLDQTLCATKPECRWMNSYTRKDGIQVSGHCRLSGKKKDLVNASDTSSSDTKPAAPPAPSAPAAASPAPATTTATPPSTLMPPTAAGAATEIPPAAPAAPKKTP